MCWVAADRGARLARLRDEHELADEWQDGRRRDPRRRSARTASTSAASSPSTTTPRPSTRRCCCCRSCASCRPRTPRIRATVLAIADELTVDGLVLRYRVDETDDGLPGEEGAFTICSFWLVSALVEIGEVERARMLCEKLLSFASPLGLYAEEIDPHSGRHLGNFPQAFTHLALINAVMHVIDAQHETTHATPLAPRTEALREDETTAAEDQAAGTESGAEDRVRG